MNVTLAIPAAGVGKRFSENVKKQFYKIDNRPILYFTLKKMASLYQFSQIILGINEEDKETVMEILGSFDNMPPIEFAKGGETRTNTVMNCLNVASGELILIHDAVRPFVTKSVVEEVIKNAADFGGAIPALPIRDTVKKAENGVITATVDRNGLYLAHTPQGFKTDLLKDALKKAIQNNVNTTDEASAFEFCGRLVKIIPSSSDNIKITFAEDLEIINMLKTKYFN